MFLLYTKFHAFIIKWAIVSYIAPICLTKPDFSSLWKGLQEYEENLYTNF